MGNTLDRKRSFGTVYGDPHVGFMQDELPYRHDGTLHESAQLPKSRPTSDQPARTPDQFPTAASFPTEIADNSPQVLKAIEQLSSQIKELKPEPLKPPDPARSEKMRQVWLERRAREAAMKSGPETELEPTAP